MSMSVNVNVNCLSLCQVKSFVICLSHLSVIFFMVLALTLTLTLTGLQDSDHCSLESKTCLALNIALSWLIFLVVIFLDSSLVVVIRPCVLIGLAGMFVGPCVFSLI